MTNVHKYERVAAKIRETIDSTLSENDALPSERELMSIHGVSRLTVRAAIAKLVDEGRVYNIQGSGTYVGSKGMFSKTLKLTSFTEDMTNRGHVPSSRVLQAARVSATDAIARRLNIPAGGACTRLRRLRLADDDPMALEDVYLPEDVLPLEELNLGRSLYAQLADRGFQIHRAEQQVRAMLLDDESCGLLAVPAGSAALFIERISSTRRGRIVEFARTMYRADRYSFQLGVARENGES